MSPSKKSIVALQYNMAKHKSVVTPTMSIIQRNEPVVMPTVSYMTAAWSALHRNKLVVAQTMVSTTLAKAEQPKNITIPPKFHQYGKVFSDEEAQQLPKHQPWDHKIDLIPGMEMKKTIVYCLTPIKKVTLKEYIEDSLKRGILHQSEAPHTCSFFFIDKKDGKLQPVQDYCPLNTITVKNTAPIPLIPELVNKLLGARFFTKLDI